MCQYIYHALIKLRKTTHQIMYLVSQALSFTTNSLLEPEKHFTVFFRLHAVACFLDELSVHNSQQITIMYTSI